jgi:hypothetical protein
MPGGERAPKVATLVLRNVGAATLNAQATLLLTGSACGVSCRSSDWHATAFPEDQTAASKSYVWVGSGARRD